MIIRCCEIDTTGVYNSLEMSTNYVTAKYLNSNGSLRREIEKSLEGAMLSVTNAIFSPGRLQVYTDEVLCRSSGILLFRMRVHDGLSITSNKDIDISDLVEMYAENKALLRSKLQETISGICWRPSISVKVEGVEIKSQVWAYLDAGARDKHANLNFAVGIDVCLKMEIL